MIYLTGDTHIPIDIDKLSRKSFPEQNQLTRDDFIIVLGDFGLLWRKDKTYRYWLDILSAKRYTLLFVDGNHENFDWLNSLPVESWHGGRVHRISENIRHLMRGEVFEIDGSTFFTLGGAVSHDRIYRTEGISWWPQEVPSKAEIDHAIDTLTRHGNQVDYVLTHTCPFDALSEIRLRVNSWDRYGNYSVEKALQAINDTIHYRDWYFGHWHMDFDHNPYHAMYNRVLRLE